LTSTEKQHIKEASHALSSMRKISLTLTLVPVLSLGISVAIAISKTVYQYEGNTIGFTSEFETSHSIALVSLLFIFVPLVVFSGSLGSFLTVNGPAEVLQKMKKNMTGDTCIDLFPDNKVIQCACKEPGPEEEKPCATAAVTHYSGIPLNSTWRPCKHILPVPLSEPEEQGERGPPFWKQSIRKTPTEAGACYRIFPFFRSRSLYASSVSFRDKLQTLSIGCRTLSWLVVSLLWISSAIADMPLSYLLRSKTLKLKLKLV